MAHLSVGGRVLRAIFKIGFSFRERITNDDDDDDDRARSP